MSSCPLAVVRERVGERNCMQSRTNQILKEFELRNRVVAENRNRKNARQTIKTSYVKQASRHNQSNKYTQNAFNEMREIEYKKYSTGMIPVNQHLVETRTPRSSDAPYFGWRRSGEQNKSD